MHKTTSEKVGTCIGAIMVVTMMIAIFYLTIYAFVYWWNNDSLSMMQIFKYVIHTRPVIFWYTAICSVICYLLQFRD